LNDDNYYIALDFEDDERIKNLKLYQYLIDRNNNNNKSKARPNHFKNFMHICNETDFSKIDEDYENI